MSDSIKPQRASHWAIGLLSCTVLLYEIAITRVLSVVLWYHWAFLVISLAMLGLGAPGLWLSLTRRPARLLRPLCVLSAVLVPASVVLIVKLGGELRAVSVLFSMGCILLPMLSLGGAICLLLMEAEGKAIGHRYAADLCGACLGAAAVIPLLWIIPTPSLVGALGLLPLAAYLLCRGRIATAAVLALALLGALLWGEPFALRYAKIFDEGGAMRPVYEKWTPTARLTFFDKIYWSPNQGKTSFTWGQGRKARPAPVAQYWVEQDGSAGTPITHFRGRLQDHRYLFDDATAVGYELRPPGSAAIVGAGGGRDILSALVSGAKRVDAIELNSGIVEALSTRFREFSGGVYQLPGVHTVISEGRSYLTRSSSRFDLIQISLTDSWASTAAGAYSLSENNLYTLEAFRLYFNRLSTRGLLSTSRWILGPLGLEVPRLLLMVQEALRREGIAKPNLHIAVVLGTWVGTVLVSRAPFAPREIDRLVGICRARGFDLLYPRSPITPVASLSLQVLERGRAIVPDPMLRLHPPTDDRPFFFQTLSPFARPDRQLAIRYGTNAEAIYSLQLLILATAAVTVLLFFLPFPLARRLVRYPGFWRGSAFFFSIGAAFMLVEIPWMQRFILYLGHPSYASTTVLGCLLLGAALGAMASARIGLARVQRFGLLLPLVVLGESLALSPLFSLTLGSALPVRIALSLLALVPPAFLMGLFFPLGMLRFGDGNKPWFWAVNGAASVLASVLSCALAIELGFFQVGLAGAGCYLLAFLLLQGEPERPVLDWSI